jgi:ribosome-binding factor A
MQMYRHDRLADSLKQKISDIIRFKTKDPRIGFVTVTHVKLSSDCRYAKIFVSVYGSSEEVKDTLEGLNSAKGFIKSTIGSGIRMRYVPDIDFVLDDTIQQSMRISELLKEINEETKNEESDTPGRDAHEDE